MKSVDRANKNATPGNQIELRKGNCVCGPDTRSECDYTAAVTAPVTDLKVDGETLELPNYPYPATVAGAADLQTDLRAAVGMAAEKVTVVHTVVSTTHTLTVTVTKTKATFTTLNATTFTNSCD